VYNFFHSARSTAPGIYRASKDTHIVCAHTLDGGETKKQNVTKNPQFIGTSAVCRNFYKKSRQRKSFWRGAAPTVVARGDRGRGTRRLHTKLSGVTVIFFPL
jgi:hypothetical protein